MHHLRPPTPDFDAHHDKAGSAVTAHQLGVSALASGGAVGTDGAHEWHPLPIVRHRREASHQPSLPVSGHPPRLVGSEPGL